MKMKAFTSEDPALPTDYPGFIVRTLSREGHAADALLAGTGLTEARLRDPHFRFAFWALRRLILNAIAQSGDPHLGIRLAQRFEASYMGLPAYAAMNAASFQDGLAVFGRFCFLTFPTIGFEILEAGASLGPGEIAIQLRPRLALGDIAYFFSISAIVGCHRLLEALLRTPRVAIRAEMAGVEPPGWSEVSGEIGFPIRFDAAETCLIVPAALLDAPLPGADPINHLRLLALCEQLARDIGYETTVTSQLVSFLEAPGNLGLPLSEAAPLLGYSERSLRRQLARSGTTYRKVAEQIAGIRARRLLRETSMPIEAIAFELGYDTASNFARSFKRWTGTSPRAFRNTGSQCPAPGQN